MKRSRAITIFVILAGFAHMAHAELVTNQPADVVVGQIDFASTKINQTGSATPGKANSLRYPRAFSDGRRLFIADTDNKRVLIYNSIPTSNNASADIVIGQPNFTSVAANQGGGTTAGANTLSSPYSIHSDGQRLFIADTNNNRVLIYNSMPASSNAPADIVIGQENFTAAKYNKTDTVTPQANTLYNPTFSFSDGKRLIIADRKNNRVLIFNSIPASSNASADVVIGQPNFTSYNKNQTGSDTPGANTLNNPYNVYSDGKRLFIADYGNNRVLIYNSIPASSNASADVVIGQPNFTSYAANQGGGTTAGANTLSTPRGCTTDGKRLFITDGENCRVLIYNSIPTSNNAPADVVIGQPDFASVAANQGGGTTAGANTLNHSFSACSDGRRLFVGEENSRILIYDISASSVKEGPQFDQGKAVLGKVFNDRNGNGWQDEGEKGISGVKVASDSGIYAITDEDGKYHFPYIETGQRLLKIDMVTLPEGSMLTTDNPYKVTVTKGILTKVSFGVKLPEELNGPKNSTDSKEPLLKVSVSQDPVMLAPKLSITAIKDNSNITFNINCNYFLFIAKSNLDIYDKDYKLVKTINLPNPIPSAYTLPVKDLSGPASSMNSTNYYYQLTVYDKNGKKDRTGIGKIEIGD